jgi:transposase
LPHRRSEADPDFLEQSTRRQEEIALDTMSPIQGGVTLDPSGYDAGKKVLGRKRHILTDTLGLLLAVIVHPASVQDRDGAEDLLREARRSFPFIERLIGDAGYQGPKMAGAVARSGTWILAIVRRCDRHRFVVPPKRWIVERTLALPGHFLCCSALSLNWAERPGLRGEGHGADG